MPQVVSTEDGSITCRDEATGELYHNRAGAYTEALENYVKPCNLSAIIAQQSSLRILDVCFGLGYNTFVLLEELLAVIKASSKSTSEFHLDLVGLDKDPEILKLMSQVLSDRRFKRLSSQFEHALDSNKTALIEGFQKRQLIDFNVILDEVLLIRFEIHFVDIRREISLISQQNPQSYDFVFHDGFSPRRMPELWTIDLFRHYVKLLKPSGKILTYSSATAVRGAFQSLGLDIKRTAALGGKSGGSIFAFPGKITSTQYVYELTDAEKTRLKSKSAIPYRDPGLMSPRKTILNARQQELSASPLPQYRLRGCPS